MIKVASIEKPVIAEYIDQPLIPLSIKYLLKTKHAQGKHMNTNMEKPSCK